MAVLKPYLEYRDSGVPWLGEVPKHWKVQKLRTIMKGVTERNRPDLPLLSVVREKGVILRDITEKGENRNFIPDDLSNYKVVREGQFVMNKMKAWQGSYGVSRYNGIVSPAYFVFDIHLVEGSYFHSAIRSKAYVPLFTQASDGVRIGQWDLSQVRMKEIPLFIPSLAEQSAIVRFLDHMDRRIRRYIRAKQKLIKLLEEQKQAIIHNAVTRGLDPNASLKPSGVEWLEDVPTHWNIVPGRSCFAINHRPNIGLAENTVLSLSYGRIVVKPKDKLHGLVPASFETYQIIEPGDIICRPTDLQNDKTSLRFGFSGSRGIITSAYISLRTLEGLNKRFGYFLLPTYDLNKIFYGLGSGLRQNLDRQDFKTLPCLLPSIPEQAAIMSFLDEAIPSIDATKYHAEREISLLHEYHTRLISDVVTGKLDVRKIDIPADDGAGTSKEDIEILDSEATMEDQELQDEIPAEAD